MHATEGTIVEIHQGLASTVDQSASLSPDSSWQAAQRRLARLSFFCAECRGEVQAIDRYMQLVLHAAASPPDGVTPERFARHLIDRQPYLLAEASQLLQPSLLQQPPPLDEPSFPPPPPPPRSPLAAAAEDGGGPRMDLRADRRLMLARLDSLGALLRGKDEVVRSLAEEAHSLHAQLEATSLAAHRQQAFVQRAQEGAHLELLQWVAASHAHRERIAHLEGDLGASRHEAGVLRAHCHGMQQQNELLRAHVHSMRQLAPLTATRSSQG